MGNLLITALILAVALMVLHSEYREGKGGMLEWLGTVKIKLAGAAVGSGVAVGFRPGKDGALRLIFRWLSGAWIGFVSTDFAVAMLGWPMDDETTLFVASALGVTGFLILQLLLAPETWQAIRRRAVRQVGGEP